MHISKINPVLPIVFVGLVLCGLVFQGVPARAQVTESSAIIVVDEAAQASVADELVARAQNSWPWYVTRASGLVAAVAMVLLMLTGIGFITGTTYSFLEPLTGWATHRALGIILAISLTLHIVALYFDHFVPFSIKDLLIPFASTYKPLEIFGISLGSLYVALGVLSFYISILIVVVSLVWVEGRKRAWKTIHLLSYLAMAFMFVHALFLGTDLSHGVLRYAWIAVGAAVLAASLARLWRAKTL
jgi:predicted ferric reductase